MKLGDKLRKILVEQSSKTAFEKIELYLVEFANNLEKGCKLKLKNFTLDERKDLIKLIKSNQIKAIGKISYSKNYFYSYSDLESMNEEYFLIWDAYILKNSKCNFQDLCDKYISKEICVEKCEFGYKVGVIK